MSEKPNKEIKHRKPNRLKDCDYSQNGHYFVTICTEDKQERFGEIMAGEMIINKLGEVAKNIWVEMPNHFNKGSLDEFIIMPNHVHGIVIIENNSVVGNAYMHSLHKKTKMRLSKVIQQYKSSITRKINLMQKRFNFQWQKSFHDHIIRNHKALDNIWEYIANNPLKWEFDVENKINIKKSSKEYYKKIIEG